MPCCSVIIPVFNRAVLTRQCLDHLLSCNTGPDFEVIVVDNASRDRTPEVLATYGDRIRVLTHDRNRFFAGACNSGATLASGQYLVFLNNDTIPLDNWLDALVDYVEAHPGVGLVASKLLYPNGTIQHAGMAVCQDYQPRHIYVGFPADHPSVDKPRRFQLVSGACNLLQREAFAAANGFDTAFVNGYEDIDLCLRLNELGYEIHYCPDSVLFHLESVSTGRFTHEERNRQLFLKRWGTLLQPDDLQLYLRDGLIHVRYEANYLEVALAPELGAVAREEPLNEVARILALRAEQVYSLLRENVMLRAGGTTGPGVNQGAA